MKAWPVYMIVIAGLVIYILTLRYCNKHVCPPSNIVTVDTQKIVTQYTSGWTKPKPDTIHVPRTIIREVPGKPPKPVFIETFTNTPITVPADTQAILRDYYSTVIYKDSTIIAGDTIRVTDQISQNRIQARQWNVSVSQIQITRTPATVYGQGGFYSSKQELIHAAEASIGYIDRRGRGLEFSVLRNDQWRYGLKFHTTLFTLK